MAVLPGVAVYCVACHWTPGVLAGRSHIRGSLLRLILVRDQPAAGTGVYSRHALSGTARQRSFAGTVTPPPGSRNRPRVDGGAGSVEPSTPFILSVCGCIFSSFSRDDGRK